MSTSFRFSGWFLLAGVLCLALGRGPLAAQTPPLEVRELCTLTHEKAFMLVATMSKDGKLLASGSFLSGVIVWDVDKAKALRTIAHTGRLHCLAFSPDGKRLAIGGEGGVRIVSVASGKDVARVNAFPSDRATCLVFMPSGKGLLAGVSGAGETAIRLYDAASGKEVRRYKGHTMGITSLAFHKDGKRFVSGGLDRTIRLWQLAKPKEMRRFEGHTGMVQSVALDADGKRLLSGGGDKTIRLWDLDSGDELSKMDEPIGSVNSVAFLPGGRAVSGGGGEFAATPVGGGVELKSSLGKQQAVRLWDLKTGKELHLFEGPAFAVTNVAVSANGRRVFAATAKDGLHMWEVPEGKEMP